MEQENHSLFKYFMGIAIMNGLDGILTYIGLQQQIVEESNPLMDYLYSVHPMLFLVIKLTFTGLVLLFAFTIKPKKNIKRWKVFLGLTNVLYIVITLIHLFWISVYFYFN